MDKRQFIPETVDFAKNIKMAMLLAKRYCQTFFGKPILSISDISLIDKPFS